LGSDSQETESEPNASDPFIEKINSLQNIEEANEFYMDNSDGIDDHPVYEKIFMTKRDSLFAPVEAPKPKLKTTQNTKSDASSPTANTATSKKEEPAKIYTGNEVYNIIDGKGTVAESLNYEKAKTFIVGYLNEKFLEWTDFKSHRNNITVFYNDNKTVITRDPEFAQLIDNMSKKECERLNDIEKQKNETIIPVAEQLKYLSGALECLYKIVVDSATLKNKEQKIVRTFRKQAVKILKNHDTKLAKQATLLTGTLPTLDDIWDTNEFVEEV